MDVGKRWRITVVMLILFLMGFSSIQAQEDQVLGVFFYSPSCPHCRDVIENHWPGIQGEFGDQLRVLFINTSIPSGSQWMHTARVSMNIESFGVPMLIIGDNVMVGAIDIPLRAPIIIHDGLENGGIPLPNIPGIESLYAQAMEEYITTSPEGESSTASTSAPSETESLGERLGRDPVANGLAIVILVVSVGSLLVAGLAARGTQAVTQVLSNRKLIVGGLALVGAGLAASVIAGWQNEQLVLALAVSVLVMFGVSAYGIWKQSDHQKMASWIFPVAALAGIVIAAYLSYIEITLTEAVCGAVGDCNTVQQSPYARVFGIPVGVIGIGGYLSLLGVWYGGRRLAHSRRQQILIGLSVIGVAFSSYLTFLEPFVIGASCVWCLMSAVVMLMLLWIVLPTRERVANSQQRKKSAPLHAPAHS